MLTLPAFGDIIHLRFMIRTRYAAFNFQRAGYMLENPYLMLCTTTFETAQEMVRRVSALRIMRAFAEVGWNHEYIRPNIP